MLLLCWDQHEECVLFNHDGKMTIFWLPAARRGKKRCDVFFRRWTRVWMPTVWIWPHNDLLTCWHWCMDVFVCLMANCAAISRRLSDQKERESRVCEMLSPVSFFPQPSGITTSRWMVFKIWLAQLQQATGLFGCKFFTG